MAHYRIYPLSPAGKVAGGYSFTGDDDAEAINYAKTLGFGMAAFEIWCGTRFFFPPATAMPSLVASHPSEPHPVLLEETFGSGKVFWHPPLSAPDIS